MPFYRFHVCDPINRIDGPGHDGAALEDDIDAMLFAAGIVQRLVQEQPAIPMIHPKGSKGCSARSRRAACDLF
jgi:hypothetical protein